MAVFGLKQPPVISNQMSAELRVNLLLTSQNKGVLAHKEKYFQLLCNPRGVEQDLCEV